MCIGHSKTTKLALAPFPPAVKPAIQYIQDLRPPPRSPGRARRVPARETRSTRARNLPGRAVA